MRRYAHHDGCLMEFLRRELDDPGAEPCGRCMWCIGDAAGGGAVGGAARGGA